MKLNQAPHKVYRIMPQNGSNAKQLIPPQQSQAQSPKIAPALDSARSIVHGFESHHSGQCKASRAENNERCSLRRQYLSWIQNNQCDFNDVTHVYIALHSAPMKDVTDKFPPEVGQIRFFLNDHQFSCQHAVCVYANTKDLFPIGHTRLAFRILRKISPRNMYFVRR